MASELTTGIEAGGGAALTARFTVIVSAATELGELIADDKALDLAEWLDIKTFLLNCPGRLILIADKIRGREALSTNERMYLSRFRAKTQTRLIQDVTF